MPVPNITVSKKGFRCSKCDYVWVPRVEDPQECPACKSRDWRG